MVENREKDTCPGGGFHRRIQPLPLVLVLHHPGRTVPQWTPAPAQPGDQTKTALIQGHDTRKFRALDQAAEVFLKAACCATLAFWWYSPTQWWINPSPP